MKNKLGDLNNHLFAQLERLSEESLKGVKLEEEVRRAHAVTNVAREIINNGKLILEAKIAIREWSLECKDLSQLMDQNGNGGK